MRRVQIREEERHRDRADPVAHRASSSLLDLSDVKRFDFFAAVAQSPSDRDDVLAWNERRRFAEVEVVQLRPRAACYQVGIARPLRREQENSLSATLEE